MTKGSELVSSPPSPPPVLPPTHSPHPHPTSTTHPRLLSCGAGAAKSSLRSTVYPHTPSRESVTSTQPGVRRGVPHDHESDDAPRKRHESLQVGRGRGAGSRRLEAALVSARQWLEHREARCPFFFFSRFLEHPSVHEHVRRSGGYHGAETDSRGGAEAVL